MKKRIAGLALSLALLLGTLATPVLAAEDKSPAYELTGSARDNGYTLTIGVGETDAIGGRLALVYDTEKLSLQGGDSFQAVRKGSGVSLTTDGVEERELVNGAAGAVGFAWYSFGLTGGKVAELNFAFREGVTVEDLDSAAFRLRVLPEEFGFWVSAASLTERTDGFVPNYYHYLLDGMADLQVRFAYEGSGREPADGRRVAVRCRDLLGAAVMAELTIDGRTYRTDAQGDIALLLKDGAYRYRLTAEGYGARYGTLEVTGDRELSMEFVTDKQLVQQAAEELSIGYQAGDTAQRVTGTLQLPLRTESGVDVSWKSSDTRFVTDTGLVYRPAAGEPDAHVTLTACLSRGTEQREKTFTLTVKAKEQAVVPPPDRKFTDLGNVGWAVNAIESMAKLGIIQGTSETTFSPEQPIKRGDFVLLLMRMMAPGAEKLGEEFSDVPAGSYYHDAILAARALGIAQGGGENRFFPDREVTRQEMAALTARAIAATKYLTAESTPGDLGAFSDAEQVASWAQETMADMVGRGFLVGNNGLLNPRGNTTRAEAAVFLYRVYQAR